MQPARPNSIQVKGHHVQSEKSGRARVFGAILIDLSLASLLTLLLFTTFGKAPLFDFGFLTVTAGVFLAFWGIGEKLIGASLGQKIFGLRSKAFRLTGQSHYSLGGTLLSIFLTAVILISATMASRNLVSKHPYWLISPPLQIPYASPSGEQWLDLPFFYLYGQWPTHFGDEPILYTLPYQKGPPKHFIGQIVARWKMPDAYVTIEGPRTSVDQETTRDLKRCLTMPESSRFRCAHLRARVLERHLDEIHQLFIPNHWELTWFEVENPEIPQQERPQGIYLSASDGQTTQERFIFVTPHSKHQTLLLNRRNDGVQAHLLFRNIIASQRSSKELLSGKLTINRQLAATRLGELAQTRDTGVFVKRLAEVQALLLSKISVDPRTFDTYYHLGGTARMLAEQATRTQNPDWSAVAKPLLFSAMKYAEDVSPEDPRTKQLQNLWLDLKKL